MAMAVHVKRTESARSHWRQKDLSREGYTAVSGAWRIAGPGKHLL